MNRQTVPTIGNPGKETDRPVINYKDVELHRGELVVLKHVDITVNPGEMVYLMGKVGCGKSTLLKSMYAEVPVVTGEASVLGYDLNGIKRRSVPFLRRKIGIVFQDFQLLTDRNVHENLMFVLRATGWRNREEIDSRIGEVLAEVGMDKKAYRMPHELSGGEQQRIVIARALLNRPGLILADEPTGNLDPETGEQIVGHLRDIASRGTAVVMATHNDRLASMFPGRTLRCEGKHVAEE